MRNSVILKHKYLPLNLNLIILTFIIFLLTPCFTAHSQNEKTRAYLKIKYVKKSDNSKFLIANLSYKENKKFVKQIGSEIIFFIGEDFDEQLETVKTNKNGEAIFKLPDEIEADSSGYYHFGAKFKGDSKLKKASKSTSNKDAIIELTFNQKSTGRNIDVTAYELIGEDKTEISDVEIIIAVPTLFGDMKLVKGSLEEGTCQIGFPEDIPGDSKGNIEIIAMINESNEYGTVEKREVIPWGIPKNSFQLEESGAKGKLWTYNAPLWMVITLIILLTGVWSHFGYVIYKMYKINKEGKVDSEI